MDILEIQEKIRNDVKNGSHFWKMSHGPDSLDCDERNTLLNNNLIALDSKTGKNQGTKFIHEMRQDDYFYLCYGNEGNGKRGSIILIGRITSDSKECSLLPKKEGEDWVCREYEKILMCKENKKFEKPGERKGKVWMPSHNSTVQMVINEELNYFNITILKPFFGISLFDDTDDYQGKEDNQVPDNGYSKEKFLEEVFMDSSKYDTLKGLIERKKNIILQGAPGVGKTFAAKIFAYSLMGCKDRERVRFVQFHQSYSYEDFVMGYRPTESGGFKLKAGVFYDFCKKAEKDSGNSYFLIIDEINRGNLSKIFGELLMLIEADKRKKEKVSLIYSAPNDDDGEDEKIRVPKNPKDEKFSVPENLYIIGMMNTADRSLAGIDYALRRRFAFFEMRPAFDNEKFKEQFLEKTDNTLYKQTVEKVIKLNDKIANDPSLGRGFEIGHSYFCPEKEDVSKITDDWVNDVIDYEIVPTIEEYCFDDETKRKELKAIIGRPEKSYKQSKEDENGNI